MELELPELTNVSIQISSLFPIDITEAVVAKTIYPELNVTIYLNSETAENTRSRKNSGSSRGSFPLMELICQSHMKWQQKHTSSMMVDNIKDELLLYIEKMYELTKECSKDVHNRIDKLRQVANKSDPNCSWSELSRNVLNFIFRDLELSNFSIEENTEQRFSGDLKKSEKERLIKYLTSLPDNISLTLNDSGKLQIRNNKEEWASYNKIKKEKEKVTLSGKENFTIHIEKLKNKNIRLRGLIENLIMHDSNHHLIDLPWYVTEAKFNTKEYHGIEFISPLSVKSEYRKKHILNPSGYSLLDYSHHDATLFCNSVLGFNSKSGLFIDEYKEILKYLPTTKERYAKSQTSLKGYIEHKENHHKKSFYCQDVNGFINENYPSNFGDRCSFLSAMLDIASPSEYKSKIDTESASKNIKSIANLDELTYESLVELVLKYDKELGDILRVNRKSLNTGKINYFDRSITDEKEISRSYKQVKKMFRYLAQEYYSWLWSSVTGTLKSHILSMYLIFGKEGLKKEFINLCKKRKVNKRYQTFSIQYED
ncbi:hypothetical protein INR79_25840 [Vibrio sp. SCSIO 43132]|uniref:hypothetical protein n=1 Tax=Vibrio sp. SCSIO 43132 TaxID=2779363 RepID=UPI001CA91238|nr:hypothetical protein [Vibrio sp. SCSIO 43132]UAB72679.1 hypothetical protein INR79_25840 [Vibrio sp. SCSIO 43132]